MRTPRAPNDQEHEQLSPLTDKTMHMLVFQGGSKPRSRCPHSAQTTGSAEFGHQSATLWHIYKPITKRQLLTQQLSTGSSERWRAHGQVQ